LYLNQFGTFYAWNNLMVTAHSHGCVGWDDFNGIDHEGHIYIWNNTCQNLSDAKDRFAPRGLHLAVLDFRNNHYIDDLDDPVIEVDTPADVLILDHNLHQGATVTTYFPLASTSGYTIGNLFTPQSGGAPSVGTGVNLTSSSTTYPLTLLHTSYNGNARSTCNGAWDIGAYTFASATCSGYRDFNRMHGR
jgi:hypothetical protein